MKKSNTCLVALFCWGVCFFLLGCVAHEVTLDLIDYVNQGILGIADLEKRSLERYGSVTGKNYTTDERVYKALKHEVIPEYKRFLELLRGINPKTDEVKKLHGIYIRGAQYLYRGFKTKMLGLEKEDEHLIRAGNEQIEKGRIENEKWRKTLMGLYEKYGIAEKEE